MPEASKTIVTFTDPNTVRCVTENGRERSVPGNTQYYVYPLNKIGAQTPWCRLLSTDFSEEIHVEERQVLTHGKFESRAKLGRLFVIDPELKLLKEWPDLLKDVSKTIPAEVTIFNTKFYVNKMIIAMRQSLKEDFGITAEHLEKAFIDVCRLELEEVDRSAVLRRQIETYELDSVDRLHVFMNITTIADVVYDYPKAAIVRLAPTRAEAFANLHLAMQQALG